MSTVHNLPSGLSVEILDVSDLKAKHKRAVQRLLTAYDDDVKPSNYIDAVDEVIKVALVSPVFSDEWFDELSLDDLTEIDNLVTPLSRAMFPPPPEPPNPSEPDNPDSPSMPGSE